MRFSSFATTATEACQTLPLSRAGIGLNKVDMSPAAQDHPDPHIRAAAIIDPGIVATMNADSLRSIDIPTGVYARPAASLIPNVNYQIVPDAIHFSFLDKFKANGAKILAREGKPDPLCDDAGGRPRSAVHDDLQNRIVAYFDSVLKL